MTHIAFANPGKNFGPFINRDLERTRHHAVPAAYAAVFVVHDRAQAGFLKGAYRANRGTGGIFAMHAQPAHITVVGFLHYGKFVVGKKVLGLYLFVEGKSPTLSAGRFAQLAAYAESAVIEEGFSHIFSLAPTEMVALSVPKKPRQIACRII
jgi:hypothetical protein